MTEIHFIDPVSAELDIDAELAKRRQIAVTWGLGDVQFMRPELDEDQAWQVLQACMATHDRDLGMTYQFILGVANRLFPVDRHERP